MKIRTQLKAGKIRRLMQTTAPRTDRLELMVVRAGLRAGRSGRGRLAAKRGVR